MTTHQRWSWSHVTTDGQSVLVSSPLCDLLPDINCLKFVRSSYITTDGQSASLSWVEFMLWPTVSRPICLGVRHPFEAHDQIFLFPFFCRTISLLFVLERPLWWEDQSVICSPICQWSDLRRIHNHTLVSPETTGFPFRRLLRLAGITVGVFLPAFTRGSLSSYTSSLYNYQADPY
jgi:hypothetical protein